MATNPDAAKTKFKKVIALLSSNQRVKDDDCDQIFQQYAAFVDSIPAFGLEKFMNFTHTSEHDQVDELLLTYMGPDEAYTKLVGVVKLLLVLSHGQASVERGFSVNKEIEIENLKEQSLVAQRLICDHVKAVDGLSASHYLCLQAWRGSGTTSTWRTKGKRRKLTRSRREESMS